MDRITEITPPVAGPEDVNLFIGDKPYFVLTFGEIMEDDNVNMGIQVGNGMSREENLNLLARALLVIADSF